MRKLEGKIAVVTGAARGLGRGYALRLAGLGAKVVIADINLKSYAEFEAEAREMTAETTADEIIAQGGESIGFEVDVGDRAAVFAMIDEVQSRWGTVDVLVANAGGGRGTPTETTASLVSQELLELVTRMNFFGTVYTCSAVAPLMKRQRAGKIVTVASIAGSVPTPTGGYAHYGANKAAIAHYTSYLAQELGPDNITVNCIAPGLIATGRIKAGAAARNFDPSAEFALRRWGTIEDCAKVVEFLTTDLSDYVTGALIPIDGGRR
jgi:3-oxoacyl-[acyl-carrier protein] reductase